MTYKIYRKTEKTASKIHYSKIGDVIIPTSGETPEEIATATCVMIPGVILAGDLNIYRTNLIDGRIVSFIINHVISDKISKVAQGKSVVHVKAEEIGKISINYPNAKEQKKILSFLELLDKKIDKQKQLVESLKSYKRGVNLQLLSRFTTHTTLDKLCTAVGGGTPDTSKSEYWQGNIQWFTPSEIGKSKYICYSDRTISDAGLKKSSAKLLPAGTVLLTTRATLGEMSISQNECTTNQGFQSLIPKSNIHSEYIYYLQVIIKQWCEKYASGNTFREISKNNLLKCKVPLLTLREQEKFILMLREIDNHIEKNEILLNSLINYKSALLQQMFI